MAPSGSILTLALSHSNHSHTDMQLIPLEKIHSSRDSIRKARESHLIDKAMTTFQQRATESRLRSAGLCRHNFEHNTTSGASGIMLA